MVNNPHIPPPCPPEEFDPGDETLLFPDSAVTGCKQIPEETFLQFNCIRCVGPHPQIIEVFRTRQGEVQAKALEDFLKRCRANQGRVFVEILNRPIQSGSGC